MTTKASAENLERQFRLKRDEVYADKGLNWEKKMRALVTLRRQFDRKIREAEEETA
jgi:lipase chaperone LimK